MGTRPSIPQTPTQLRTATPPAFSNQNRESAAPRSPPVPPPPGGGDIIGGSGGSSPRKNAGSQRRDTRRVRAWGDAGWLRGQTTRRRIHRRSDGGPERR